ncbi:MAG: hypothetical protein JSW50_01440 [Candidatus Latescibacterota bacterium]|nr:MAG: hypothetical protein JSW50_01440 [Candidatus Latescibacterota bacterium]
MLVQNNDTRSSREQLLGILRRSELLFATKLIDHDGDVESISPDSIAGLVQRSWNDQPCFYAYSDPSFSVENHDVYIGFPGGALAGFIKQFNDEACLVINPGGPGTVVLSMAELEAMATDGMNE